MDIVIRENIDEYLKGLKEWISGLENHNFEEMDEFFKARIDDYEEHMEHWEDAYTFVSNQIPKDTKKLLDVGCGTGLELDNIFKILPHVSVTGIDLCETMLQKLQQKHGDKHLSLICGDYFQVPFKEEEYDAVISFQSLHHFKGSKKVELFKKIYNSLKHGGEFIQCDYIACCEEEEELLSKKAEEIRRENKILEDVFIHFDTPLTLKHEIELLKKAGFKDVKPLCAINGATTIVCKKI
ncbi:tRNA (cmo5U34)-methyltransferase [Hathewaya proteolytica DSM 3090]|uniref:tRNA (Cmo5U34)-methyltransferase n=1 Tax=Hathewaya proteolytica DSM 3090 TaxID=1121331 RepID=A0A1M6RQ09_9CLOT|nr:class I SAM-dependent methyltransferase [Hathewaya proteolytica]SHK34504.1 tRNA (cmo5U34)-methyltransferase [Hathewaya proteolytica DSM 3090]